MYTNYPERSAEKNNTVSGSMMKNKVQFILVVLFVWAVFFQNFAHAQVRSKDNNVWVYSDLFVERFGLSPEFATDELKGAHGVAIRLVPLVRPRCHQSANGEECVPSYQWLLDLYVDIEQDVGIVGDSPRQYKPWRSSLYFLARKDPILQTRWEEAFGLKGGKLYIAQQDGTRLSIKFDIFSYKRPIKKGLLMIQARIGDEIIFADSEKPRIIEFENSDGRILHKITLPHSYWPRVAAYRALQPDITHTNWQGGVERDPHLWIYTKEFAEKYDMPLSGISDEMEGAMAMTFRKDSYGTEKCGFFSDPTACNRSFMDLWNVYIPGGTKLYYADDTIDNFYSGYHPSDNFLHERKDRSDWDGTYPSLVQGEGMQSGARVHRSWKRKFFNLIKAKEKTRWYGGPIRNYSYLQPQVLDAGFTFAEFSDGMRMGNIGVDQYLIVNSSPGVVRLRDLYDSHFHKARLPRPFMDDMLQYVEEFEEKNGSIIKFVEKRLKAEAGGSN